MTTEIFIVTHVTIERDELKILEIANPFENGIVKPFEKYEDVLLFIKKQPKECLFQIHKLIYSK